MISKFIDGLRQAAEEGCSIQIPYRMENGTIAKADKGFFDLLSALHDDDPLKVIEITDTKLIIEIQNRGIKHMVKYFNSIIEDEC